MNKFFLLKASRISLALNRSWHKVFFFSLIFYAATYVFLHFQAVRVSTQSLFTALIETIQAAIL